MVETKLTDDLSLQTNDCNWKNVAYYLLCHKIISCYHIKISQLIWRANQSTILKLNRDNISIGFSDQPTFGVSEYNLYC